MDTPTARHLAALLSEDPSRHGVSGGAAPPGFEVFEQIGEGASGRVYLAQREGSERPVALKVMKKPLGEGKSAQRAWRELGLLTQIRSSRVPALLDHGTHRGRLFIATEFVDGLPIDEYVRSAGPGRRARVELLARVCEAAGELHNHGVIHRDLKPSNILVTPAGEPVIIDLGIAALVAGDVMETLTADGTPIGTPAYMAPEQARGERDAVGIRSDVWALGAVCCRVLTGRTPHDLEGITLYEAVRRVGALPAREPTELNRTLPRALGAVVSKACSMRAGDRYASATELAADLRRWLRREPVEAQPPGAWVKVTRWMARHPVLTTAGVCAGMVGMTAATVGAVLRHMMHEPYSVASNSDNTLVWIESRTRRNVATIFDTTSRDGFRAFPLKVDRPSRFGGGWIVAMVAPPSGEKFRRLTFHDPSRPSKPIWTEPECGPYPPLALPAYDAGDGEAQHQYNARRLLCADVFKERPGDEIATVSTGTPAFPSCLRVFGTDGTELFRAWVPGHMMCLWLEHESAFLLWGWHNRLPTPEWDGISASDRPSIFPAVVVLVRPELDRLDDRWLTYRVPGSPSNVDRCWVLEQPGTHAPLGVRRAEETAYFKIEISPTQGTPGTFYLELLCLRGQFDSSDVARVGWATNLEFERLTNPVASNSFADDEEFVALLDRASFEEAPAFDPNAR